MANSSPVFGLQVKRGKSMWRKTLFQKVTIAGGNVTPASAQEPGT